MIFPILECELKVQENDKTRLDARKTFTTPDEGAITKYEIEPEADAGYFDVTTNKYLDWSYSLAGTATVSLRITIGVDTETATKDIEVLSESDDCLFSKDSEIIPYEPDVLDFVRSGRSSFIDVHRSAKDNIISKLVSLNLFGQSGNKVEAKDLIGLDDVKGWSKFLTLQTIFEGISNASDDVFSRKADKYALLAKAAEDKTVKNLDRDSDGVIDDRDESIKFATVGMRLR